MSWLLSAVGLGVVWLLVLGLCRMAAAPTALERQLEDKTQMRALQERKRKRNLSTGKE